MMFAGHALVVPCAPLLTDVRQAQMSVKMNRDLDVCQMLAEGAVQEKSAR
uniref:Uncharacterized protein n=1 Tax=Arion vulgaris TaxID=1028688 RepID=A0A0B6ZRE3_9EUPU